MRRRFLLTVIGCAVILSGASAFRTRSNGMGKVIRVSRAKVPVWALSKPNEIDVGWFQIA
ncbi:MAG: hypothetical protein QOH41_1542 [Blastocatellia bacterium]|jgi:hypothetical protein|nr:hypothetical protein [Blastocatellia bacterium]